MAVSLCAQDGWMDAANCSSRPCSPDVYTVRVHARVRAIRMYRRIDVRRHLLSQSCLQRVTKRPVTDLTGKTQAVLSPSTVKRFLEVEQAPTQGRPPRRSAPDLSAVREGDLSDRLHQEDYRGTGVPSVQGPR